MNSLRRQLAHQVSLSGIDLSLPSTTPGSENEKGWDDAAVAVLLAAASWGSQLDLTLDPLTEEDVLQLDYTDNDDITSNLLTSEEDEEDDIFTMLVRAAQPTAPATLQADEGGGTPLLPPPRWTCSRCANVRLPDWTSPVPPP